MNEGLPVRVIELQAQFQIFKKQVIHMHRPTVLWVLGKKLEKVALRYVDLNCITQDSMTKKRSREN